MRYPLRFLFWGYGLALAFVSLLSRRPARRRRAPDPQDSSATILATGTFYSANWLRSHVLPILDSPACRRLVLVCDGPMVEHPKLENCTPPAWLRRVIGRVASRAVVLFIEAVRRRPDFIIGYHLIPNALLTLLASQLVGARSIYQCCGGPSELDGGGPAMRENGLLRHLPTADPAIARRLRSYAARFDVIVTRGDDASAFFNACGASGRVITITAGIDADRFMPRPATPEYDLIAVGRLSVGKCLDQLVDILDILARRGLTPRTAIVGDGPCRAALEEDVRRRGLAAHVHFAGSQEDVATWLQRSGVFVMTSASEGLSIALAEAMLCGLPAVATRVGDLATLVRDGENGYLVEPGRADAFADRIEKLLRDPDLRAKFAARARERAEALCSRPRVADRWTELLVEAKGRC